MKRKLSFATYPQNYYTGAQVRIYFGSVWVDDVATISYQTNHSKVPLYGYGDHQFRAVAKGQFLVRGSFTIAFKETGYLYSIINLIKNDYLGVEGVSKENKENAFSTFQRYIADGNTIEQALDKAATAQQTRKKMGTNTPSSDFEDISEVLEDVIWSKPNSTNTYGDRIPRSDELDYYKYTKSDLTGLVGTGIDRVGFDILMTFGNYKSGSDSAEHTIISLNDVHITSESMILSPSAEPIGLTCEFFARGINERVSNAWPEVDKFPVREAKKPQNDTDKASDNISKALDAFQKQKSPTPEVQGPPVSSNPPQEPLPSLSIPYVGDTQKPADEANTTPEIPKAISPVGLIAKDPSSENIQNYIKTNYGATAAEPTAQQKAVTIAKSNKPVTKISPVVKKIEPVPIPAEDSKTIVIGPLTGDKQSIFQKAKALSGKDYADENILARVSITGNDPDLGGSIIGKVSKQTKFTPWVDLSANYKVINENILVLTNVKCVLPNFLLKSSLTKFLKS